MRILRYILILGCILNGMFISSCDVHEFPDPSLQEMSFLLHLNYDTELPLYKVITYHNDSRAYIKDNDYNIRYIVQAYSTQGEYNTSDQTESYQFIFTKDDISVLNNSVELKLKPGVYNFVVWSDYISGVNSDLYYDTSKFEEISLKGDVHNGSCDYRDAFVGSTTCEVSKNHLETTVEMSRPMAKFNFISDDVSKFVSTIKTIRAEKNRSNVHNQSSEANNASEGNDIQFSDFDVVFRYNGFMPHVFNPYINKPSDAKTNVSFKSKIKILENGDAELGFDYVFVNGTESLVNVSVEIYDNDGELISSFKPIDVPLVRSKLTTIKANFLTSGIGGVAIIPGFDGEYNYQVD